MLQYFRWLEVVRSITVAADSVTVTYDCRFVPTAFTHPDPILDLNGNGIAEPREKDQFMTQARDYVTSDLYIVNGAGTQLPVRLGTYRLGTNEDSFHAEYDVTLPTGSASATTESLTILDPALLFAQIGSSQQVKPTRISANAGVRLLEIKPADPGSSNTVVSSPQCEIRFQRSAATMAAGASVPGPISVTAESTPSLAEVKGATEGQKLRNLINTSTSPALILVSLCVAALLGAAHALTPGHGKTIVAAYLVGSGGRVRDAVYLGLIVTFTHTSSVILLGLITLFASHYMVQDRLYSGLGLVSGLLVFGFGVYLFVQRLRASGVHAHGLHLHTHEHGSHSHHHDQGHHNDEHYHGHEHDNGMLHTHGAEEGAMHRHDDIAFGGEPHVHHEHAHAHPEIAGGDLVHSHGHEHVGSEGLFDSDSEKVQNSGLRHSHGGRMHTHPIPHRLTWKGLLSLGVSGGIVPCPDAIVVLLVAVALHRIALGLAIIGAFSVGLAVVLIGIGILMVTARPFVERLGGGASSRFTQFYLPVGSAAIVMLLGLGIVGKVLMDMGIVSVNL